MLKHAIDPKDWVTTPKDQEEKHWPYSCVLFVGKSKEEDINWWFDNWHHGKRYMKAPEDDKGKLIVGQDWDVDQQWSSPKLLWKFYFNDPDACREFKLTFGRK